jgi:hypothetical protein
LKVRLERLGELSSNLSGNQKSLPQSCGTFSLPKPVRGAMWEYDDEFSEYGDTMDLDGGKSSFARLTNGFTTLL